MTAAASTHIAFRVDASLEIGTGHVMRCLTLADALRQRGASCSFICRPHAGHLCDLIAARGHLVAMLPALPDSSFSAPSEPPHAHWLGTSWQQDAEDTRHLLATKAATDWLIVDHYALDHRWQQALRPSCRRLMVMDDLADRRHDCDLLLDPSLGRTPADYAGLLPPGADMLLGPQYALLRPEFAALRAESLTRRRNPELRHLLITMGGVDKDNATGRLLDTLNACPLPSDLQITVVMGPHAPWLAQVQEKAAGMHRPCQVLVGVRDMARLMTDSDLAIGAAGGTSWERCCMGLPSFVLILADNQIVIAREMERAGAAISLGRLAEPGWQEKLMKEIAGLQTATPLSRLSATAAQICDGEGASRVRAEIRKKQFTIRNANRADARRIWEWRHEGVPPQYYKNAAIPTYSEHQQWFAKALKNTDRTLLIICKDDEPVSHVRIDHLPESSALVSIYVSPARRGQGIATPSLLLALDRAARDGVHRFLAQVHENNQPSAALFEKAGFIQTGRDGRFLNYQLEVTTSRTSGTS